MFDNPLALLLVIVFSYLLGSVPFGLLLTRAAGLGDIRKIGSGNIGATNVLRTGNKKIAALTLFLDGFKGSLAVLIVRHFDFNLTTTAAIAVMIGHLFPAWLRFKGGKGVATGIGAMLALCWPAGLAIMVTWLAIAKWLQISSLSALIAFALSPIYVMLFNRADLVPVALLISALVFFTHRANIHRLFHKKEPKIGS